MTWWDWAVITAAWAAAGVAVWAGRRAAHYRREAERHRVVAERSLAEIRRLNRDQS